MTIYADKSQENKDQPKADSLPKVQNNSEAASEFTSGHPGAITQRKLQQAINSSPPVQQLKAYQQMVNDSLQVKKLNAYQLMADSYVAQRKENPEEKTIQGNFFPVQKKENKPGLPASSPIQLSSAVIQMVTSIPRPTFTKEVINTIKLEKGQHRRHVVMSSRMRSAIFAYHTVKEPLYSIRRKELQKIVGGNTLRTEMGEMARRVHNSMGNLFAGQGSENTAIGFAVDPLYEIADKISKGKLKTYGDIVDEVKKWDKKGIFGFALEHKKSIGEIILAWLDNKENHDGDMDNIASAIRDFAFSCSFDLAYEKGNDEGDEFPSHINKDDQKNLLAVAQVLEEVIKNPPGQHKLYEAFNYLIEIAGKYK